MPDGTNALTIPGRGENFVAPLSQTPRFGDSATRLHRRSYDDYDVARQHILQALGDISEIEIFGRDVMVAVFCRLNVMRVGPDKVIYMPVKEIKEDWWQGKAVLVVAVGPDAFQGDQSYLDARYGGKPPRVGDWLFARADAGVQMSIHGEGGTRPQGVDQRGEAFDLFEWDGWPCRVVPDDRFFGRVTKPHQVV
jgi:hypothetical protein